MSIHSCININIRPFSFPVKKKMGIIQITVCLTGETVTFLCSNKKVTKEVVRGEALRINRILAPDPTLSWKLMDLKDRRVFCGTTLFAGISRPPLSGANTPAALNAGNTSANTRGSPLSSCPRRPICCPACRSDLSPRNSLWMLATALLPRLWFLYGFSSLNYRNVRLSRTIFRTARNRLPKGQVYDKM